MSSEHYYKDPEEYLLVFKKHSKIVARMMAILNDQITQEFLDPVESHKLYRMSLDLLFYTDKTYEEERNLPDKYQMLTFPVTSDDEMLCSIRSILKEELDRYLGSSDATNQ